MGTLADIISSGVRSEDLPGDLGQQLDPLLRFANQGIGGLQQQMQHGLTLTDNLAVEIVTPVLSHGVAQLVQLKQLSSAAAIIGYAVGGQKGGTNHALAFPPLLQRTSNARQVKITCYFLDQTATRVQMTLVLAPEGLASGAAPSLASTLAKLVSLAVGSAGQILTMVGGVPVWAAPGGGGGGQGGWTLAQKPASADSRDEEFEGDLSVWTADIGTLDGGTIDPYANEGGGAGHYLESVNGIRPSWFMLQPDNSGTACGISKNVTLGANEFVWTRISELGPHTSVSNVRIGIWSAGANFIELVAGTNASGYLVLGASDTFGNITANVVASWQVIEYLGIHKIGTTYYFWWAPSEGGWQFLGSGVNAMTPTRVRIYTQGVASTAPGSKIFGYDFVRFKATATDIP